MLNFFLCVYHTIIYKNGVGLSCCHLSVQQLLLSVFGSLYFSSNTPIFSLIFMYKELPCSFNITYTVSDILFYSKLVVILRSVCSMFVLWKVWGHVVAGKEMLKYMQAFWKSPRFFLTTKREVVLSCFYQSWWAL